MTKWEIHGTLSPGTLVDVGISQPVVQSFRMIFVRNKSITSQKYQKIENHFLDEVTKSPTSTWSMEYIMNYKIFKIHSQHSYLTTTYVQQRQVKIILLWIYVNDKWYPLKLQLNVLKQPQYAPLQSRIVHFNINKKQK